MRRFAEGLRNGRKREEGGGHLVGHVQGVIVLGQAHVRLLVALRRDEGVDLEGLDVLVHLGHGVLDLLLVRPLVHNKHQRVVVLDLLHRGLRRQRVLDDLEAVELLGRHGRLPVVHRLPQQRLRLRPVEGRRETRLPHALAVRPLLHGVLRGGGLPHAAT